MGRPGAGSFVCWLGSAHLWHVRQPVQDSENPFEVIANDAVGHPIVVHDLDAPELVIGGIYLPPKDLEEQAREDTCLDRNKGKVYSVILSKMGFFSPQDTDSSLCGLFGGTIWTFILKRKLRK